MTPSQGRDGRQDQAHTFWLACSFLQLQFQHLHLYMHASFFRLLDFFCLSHKRPKKNPSHPYKYHSSPLHYIQVIPVDGTNLARKKKQYPSTLKYFFFPIFLSEPCPTVTSQPTPSFRLSSPCISLQKNLSHNFENLVTLGPSTSLVLLLQ